MAVGAGVWSLIHFWDWLQTEQINGNAVAKESGSTTVRNIGFIVAGLIALPFAFWRSSVAQRQADTAQQNLLNERYQQGAEMLGSDVLAVRLGGIYALECLAAEHPEQYHIQIMQLLCSFVCYPTIEKARDSESENLADKISGLRGDVLAVVTAISACHATQLDLEGDAAFQLNLAGANLSGARLNDVDLSGARLWGADLSDARLPNASLSGTSLNGANLSGARLGRTNLSSARLSNANLSGARLYNSNLSGARLTAANLSSARLRLADLSGAMLWRANLSGANLAGANLSSARFFSHEGRYQAIGLTQAQLDESLADPSSPPKLHGVVDAETGKPLVWRGKSLDGQT